MTVLFEGSARALLLVHAVLGFTAVFATTHHAVSALLAALGRPVQRQLQRFGWMASTSLVAQAFFGLLLYPAYRVRVRFADLERSAPAVVQLFDLKEHLSALALALVVGASFAGRALPGNAPAAESRAVAALSGSGAALVWAAALIGLYVTARHPVGAP
ncbi:MAG: hypothetical protein ACJ79H_09735 [Myxococcales bacterium]